MHQLTAEHPSREQLLAYGGNALGEGEAAALETHISSCVDCWRVIAALPDDPLLNLLRASNAPDAAAPPLRLNAGYELGEQIGQGGMGVVYKARQVELRRVVALKRIQTLNCNKPETLQRFRREAEAIARLDHPHIVRVFEVGEQDGQPYLALEYIEGGTLRQRLAGQPLLPADAARLVEQLARAIQHAHERGIIHRDLKPANVLLANNQLEPKITDFGLAKLLDQEAGQTRTGDLLGTPAYMAPEQTGPATPIGPATDIYALGAILYETLTGRPPFQGVSVLDTLEQVRTQDPVPPARLQPKVPRDLNTICLKCLEKAPRQRYASAAALAEDLQRFREGLPIHARPVRGWERAWKWARRRPALAGLSALSALMVVALAVGLWLHVTRLDEQVRRAEENEARARAEQRRADLNYQHARHAIQQMLERLGTWHAPGVPQLEVLRRALREDALKYYEAVASTEDDLDPATRFDIAEACRLLGDMRLAPEQRRSYLERSRRLLEELLVEQPDNLEYQAELARCVDASVHIIDDVALVLAARKQALAMREKLCRLQPGRAEWQMERAKSHVNIGVALYTQKGDRHEIEDQWQQAARIQEQLVEAHADDANYRYVLAISYSNLALLNREHKRHAEADALYRKAVPLLTWAVAARPEHVGFAQALAQTEWLWGVCATESHRLEEAEAHLQQALAIVDRLIRGDPQFAGWRELQLSCHVARFGNCTLREQTAEAEAEWQTCLELSAKHKDWREICRSLPWESRLGAPVAAARRALQLMQQPALSDEDRLNLAAALAGAPDYPKAQAAASALLQQLARKDYFKDAAVVQLLAQDENLHALRAWPEFERLLSPRPK